MFRQGTIEIRVPLDRYVEISNRTTAENARFRYFDVSGILMIVPISSDRI